MNYKKYLKESTTTSGYPDTGGLVGDDDFPAGNILMGTKYKKTGYYNRLTNFNINWVIDDEDWEWDYFDATASQSSTQAYHDSLKGGNDYSMADRLFKRMSNKEIPDVPKSSRLLGNDIGPFTDAWGNPESEHDYEKTADTNMTDLTVDDIIDDIERENAKAAEKPYRPRVYKDVIKKINGLL